MNWCWYRCWCLCWWADELMLMLMLMLMPMLSRWGDEQMNIEAVELMLMLMLWPQAGVTHDAAYHLPSDVHFCHSVRLFVCLWIRMVGGYNSKHLYFVQYCRQYLCIMRQRFCCCNSVRESEWYMDTITNIFGCWRRYKVITLSQLRQSRCVGTSDERAL